MNFLELSHYTSSLLQVGQTSHCCSNHDTFQVDNKEKIQHGIEFFAQCSIQQGLTYFLNLISCLHSKPKDRNGGIRVAHLKEQLLSHFHYSRKRVTAGVRIITLLSVPPSGVEQLLPPVAPWEPIITPTICFPETNGLSWPLLSRVPSYYARTTAHASSYSL